LGTERNRRGKALAQAVEEGVKKLPRPQGKGPKKRCGSLERVVLGEKKEYIEHE